MEAYLLNQNLDLNLERKPDDLDFKYTDFFFFGFWLEAFAFNGR